MSYELPLYRQEKDNTCALACLRMVLAAFGRDVDETELEIRARLEIHGTAIDELERLARLFGLLSRAQEANVEQLRELLAEGKRAIAYIDRAVFDLPPRRRAERPLRDARIHTVSRPASPLRS